MKKILVTCVLVLMRAGLFAGDTVASGGRAGASDQGVDSLLTMPWPVPPCHGCDVR